MVDNYEVYNERKWPLGPDIVEECQAVTEMEEVREDTWTPIFEPHDFNEENGPLLIDTYWLT